MCIYVLKIKKKERKKKKIDRLHVFKKRANLIL